MLKKMMFMLMALTLVFVPTLASAATIEDGKKYNATQEELEAQVKELEYIFSVLMVKDDKTGKYVLNKEELAKSSYNNEEKAAIIAGVYVMNDEEIPSNMYSSNVWERCWQDALGIGKSYFNQVKSYLKKEDYWGALGMLSLLGLSVNPAVLFAFAVTCGPAPAYIAPNPAE
ncbi:hypothetical protein COL01_11130 [Bacillus thuringiensis]|uniref:hypothetical protein n=1 Tax=Bacillus thuringiensis TaxID=1428 RepID=UPI000BF9DE73|nr:hypothetical protein [Bacillus thuringiensis]PFV34684.1 hypothetical protein COL01_11130 [Bacillus thuringiensis]